MIRARRRCGIVVSSLWTFFILSLTVPTIWHIENIGLQFFWPNVYFKCAFSKIWDCRRCQMSDVINVNASVMWCVLYRVLKSFLPRRRQMITWPRRHLAATAAAAISTQSRRHLTWSRNVTTPRTTQNPVTSQRDGSDWLRRRILSSCCYFLLVWQLSFYRKAK